MSFDPTVTTAVAFGAMTWLLAITFAIGRYSERQSQADSRQSHVEAKIGQIFDRLETLSRNLPHVCIQAERLARVEEHVRQLENVE